MVDIDRMKAMLRYASMCEVTSCFVKEHPAKGIGKGYLAHWLVFHVNVHAVRGCKQPDFSCACTDKWAAPDTRCECLLGYCVVGDDDDRMQVCAI